MLAKEIITSEPKATPEQLFGSSEFLRQLLMELENESVEEGFRKIERDVLGEYFIEMICDAHRSGLKITEVGYAFKDRTEGFSKSMPSLFSFMRTGTHYFYRIVKVWSRLGGK